VTSDATDCSVRMAKHAEINLPIKLSIWDFHDNVSSNIKPKNLMCCTLDMGSFIWSVCPDEFYSEYAGSGFLQNGDIWHLNFTALHLR
jgi:hypothetical protein